MSEDLFNQSLHLTARLVDRGDYDDAALVLRPWLITPLSNAHKSIACVNLAVISDFQGREDQAVAWYDTGIGYERAEGRIFVAEQKAAYLARRGHRAESLQLYEDLLRTPGLTQEERERIAGNIEVMRNEKG